MLVLSLQLSFLWLNWFGPGSLRYHMTYLLSREDLDLGVLPTPSALMGMEVKLGSWPRCSGTKNVQPHHTILPLSPLVIGSRDLKNLKGCLNSNRTVLQQLGHKWRLEGDFCILFSLFVNNIRAERILSDYHSFRSYPGSSAWERALLPQCPLRSGQSFAPARQELCKADCRDRSAEASLCSPASSVLGGGYSCIFTSRPSQMTSARISACFFFFLLHKRFKVQWPQFRTVNICLFHH